MDQNRLEQLAQEFEAYLRERRVFGSAWTNGIILEVEINWETGSTSIFAVIG